LFDCPDAGRAATWDNCGEASARKWQHFEVKSSPKPVGTLCPAHASSATDGTFMPVHLTDSHVYDAQMEISQAKDSILPEQAIALQSCPCCRKTCQAAIESACVDVTHLCSAAFYDSAPFMPDDAAES